MQEAPGVALLDEIGTKLHPNWRRRVIEDLRRAFPRMQFLATTHEPPCLGGLTRNEVVILHRRGGDVVIASGDDRDPRTMRVDKLLTSPFFGLDSSIEPRIVRKFQRFYKLRAYRFETLSPEIR